MTLRPCLGIDGDRCPALTVGSRCARCQAVYLARVKAPYRGEWRAMAAGLVAFHRAVHGDWCPGWRRAGHNASDLVVDHDEGVMCRQCNSAKAGSVDRVAAQTRKRAPHGG